MSVTIIYGSDGGCTRKIAKSIAAKTSGKAIDISDAEPTDMENCSLLLSDLCRWRVAERLANPSRQARTGGVRQ